MKICHLTSVHKYMDTRIFLKQCKSLANKGYEVHLIVTDAPSTIIDQVNIHGIIKGTSNRFVRMTNVVRKIYQKALEINADIYHFHDPELIPLGLKLKRKGKKVIYDVHEDVPRQILTKEWLPKYLHKTVSKIFEAYENKAAKKFDYIITATPHIRDRFLKLGCKVVDINNYPLLDELNIDNNVWSNKENAMCYVGGISYSRGIQEMIKAIDSTDRCELYLGGYFFDEKEKECVTNMSGWRRVKELGFLNRQQVKEVYKQSKGGLVTLRPEINYIHALPVKMFEYMSSGIPVIASDFPLWKSIVDENQCGICVNPLDIQEITNAINWLVDNPKEAELMGINGRKAVEEKYNWENEVSKLLDVYISILEEF